MSATDCSQFIEQLDNWMEGDRHTGAQDHVQDCVSCRSIVSDLDAIQTAAPLLSVGDPEPPARVWAALRIQLEQEGLIRDTASETVPQLSRGEESWFARIFGPLSGYVPRPALATAYLSLLVIVAFGLAGLVGGHAPQAPSFPLSAQLANYEQTTVSSFASSKSPVSASLHQNLELVDHYIALCEKSVADEPENDAAREYLYHAYQQKADLLALITEHGDSIQ
jgi:hypothetical protein